MGKRGSLGRSGLRTMIVMVIHDTLLLSLDAEVSEDAMLFPLRNNIWCLAPLTHGYSVCTLLKLAEVSQEACNSPVYLPWKILLAAEVECCALKHDVMCQESCFRRFAIPLPVLPTTRGGSSRIPVGGVHILVLDSVVSRSGAGSGVGACVAFVHRTILGAIRQRCHRFQFSLMLKLVPAAEPWLSSSCLACSRRPTCLTGCRCRARVQLSCRWQRHNGPMPDAPIARCQMAGNQSHSFRRRFRQTACRRPSRWLEVYRHIKIRGKRRGLGLGALS
jgi:radical SAM protein with 4Fe4S-binding SPASM domain